MTTLNYLKKLHGNDFFVQIYITTFIYVTLSNVLIFINISAGPVVSNLDRDLLRDVSSKLDIMLMNQRRILNEIFPDEAVVERPENCPPLPLRDEQSFEAFNEFLKNKIAFSQFVSAANFFGYLFIFSTIYKLFL